MKATCITGVYMYISRIGHRTGTCPESAYSMHAASKETGIYGSVLLGRVIKSNQGLGG